VGGEGVTPSNLREKKKSEEKNPAESLRANALTPSHSLKGKLESNERKKLPGGWGKKTCVVKATENSPQGERAADGTDGGKKEET